MSSEEKIFFKSSDIINVEYKKITNREISSCISNYRIIITLNNDKVLKIDIDEEYNKNIEQKIETLLNEIKK